MFQQQLAPGYLQFSVAEGKVGLDIDEQKRVFFVKEGGWAASMGILIGDLIAQVNGMETDCLNQEGVRGVLKNTRPLTITVHRGQKGAQYLQFTRQDGKVGLDIDDQKRVHFLKDGGWAVGAGLRVGDLIVEINGIKVAQMTQDQVRQHLGSLRPLVITVERK